MGLHDLLTDIGGDRSQPTEFHCSECGRSFTVEKSPDRVVCSRCGNEDVAVGTR